MEGLGVVHTNSTTVWCVFSGCILIGGGEGILPTTTFLLTWCAISGGLLQAHRRREEAQ